MFKLLTILFIFSAISVDAQMLDNTKGETFGDVPFFNEAFVKRNKLKSIKGYYSTKASLDYIRKSQDIYRYEFNENGQLTLDYRTQYGDTLVSTYEYDITGRLIISRKSDNNGYYSYHYTYDNKNRVLSKEFRRDVNKSGSKINFMLDRTFIMRTEKFEYVDLEGLNYKKVYFNTTNRVFKEEFFYFNENDYLVKQEGRMKMGSGINNITYTYDEFGQMVKKISENHIMGKSTSKWTYEYDEHYNVLAQHYYKNDKYLTEYQIVYAPETMLLDAIITRDNETNLVTILSFSEYTFFN